MLATESPFPQYFDLDGTPLNSGSLFFGVANLNPETNPITVYWDSAGTQPAAQPIPTLNGYTVRNGTPAVVFANSDYSLNVRNSRGNLVYTSASAAAANNAFSLQSSSGSSLVGFIQAGAGAVARTVQSKLRDIINVRDFGTVGDGVADDTTAIQAAITAAAGKALYLPTGIYKISAALTITGNYTSIFGDGSSSKIITNNATTSIFVLGDGISEIRGITFKDFAIDSSVNKTDGYAIHGMMIARSSFTNIYITRPEDLLSPPALFNGYYFDRFDYCSVFGGNVIVKNNGISCRGNADQSFGAGLFIDGGIKISGNNAVNSIGILVGGASGGVVIEAADVIACETGMAITTTLQAGIANREVFCGSACTFDSSGSRNVQVSASSITHLTFSGTWIASAGARVVANGQGIAVDTPNANLVMIADGVRMFNNRGGGYLLDAGDFTITGGSCQQNGLSAPGFDGIKLTATTVTNLRMSGVKVDNNGTAGVGYGFKTIAGAPSVGLTVDGCSFIGNAQGNVSHPDAFGPTKIFKDNLGFVTENIGTATVVNGQAGVVVTHGIDPSRNSRAIGCPLTVNPEAGTWYFTAPNTANFTIFLSVVATRDNHFTWKAEAY